MHKYIYRSDKGTLEEWEILKETSVAFIIYKSVDGQIGEVRIFRKDNMESQYFTDWSFKKGEALDMSIAFHEKNIELSNKSIEKLTKLS